MLAVASAVGVLAVACGGGTERLSAREYRSKASARCEQLKDAGDELRRAQEPSAVGATVARFLDRAADRLRDLVRGLDDLEPPRASERDAAELLDLLDEYAAGLDELAGRVSPGDTLGRTFEQNQELVQRLNGVAGEATTLVTRLDLTGCILTS